MPPPPEAEVAGVQPRTAMGEGVPEVCGGVGEVPGLRTVRTAVIDEQPAVGVGWVVVLVPRVLDEERASVPATRAGCRGGVA